MANPGKLQRPMASLDLDLIRHALKTAQEHGFAEVAVGTESGSFKASLQAGTGKRPHSVPLHSGPVERVAPEGEFVFVKSPIVGFYSAGPSSLEVGRTVGAGDVVGVVNALGIANDIESQVSGEVVEVFVRDGDALEFGQILAKVKP